MIFKPVQPSRGKRLIAAVVFAGFGLTTLVPIAEAETAPELTPEQTAAIDEIGSYINGFRSLQGEFTQVSPKGTVSKGVFYLSKPGKMRFEYSPPNPFIIVSDG